MHAVEIDERMIEVLRRDLPALDVAHGDMLQLDLGALATARGGPLSIVSNTPYYLTSPWLFKLIAAPEHVSSVVLTMQREVCQKILAPPRCKDYTIISVMLQLFGSPEHLFDLPPEAFAPKPKITSSVVQLTPSAAPRGEDEPLSPAQRAALLGLLKVSFEHRRKMLRVSLKKPIQMGTIAPPPEDFLTMRPEQLDPEQWLELARACLGDDLGEGRARDARARLGSADATDGEQMEDDAHAVTLLERSHIGKKWKAHKAGYK